MLLLFLRKILIPACDSSSWALHIEAGKVVWYSPLSRISLFVVIHTVRGFSVVNEAEVDVFLEFSCFFCIPMDVGNLISGSSAFTKSSFYIWKFSVHILLKPSLKDLKNYLASMLSEHNYIAVWTFFAITLLWDYHASIIFLNVNSISGPISKSQNVNILWMFVDNLLRKPGNPYNEVIKGRK